VFRHDDGRDEVAEELAGFVRRALGQRQVDVQSARARRLGNAGHVEPVEFVLHPAGDVEDAIEAGALAAVEVDRRVILVQGIGHAGEPGVL
jgi:hypothetical protein